MIRLRSDVPAPDFLVSEKIKGVLEEARKAVAEGRKPDLQDHWARDEDTRQKQHERHYDGKCCYCERKRDISLERDVEHYRPKKAVEDVDGHPGYWWLAYEWGNLLISCKTCNTLHKGNQFPLADEDKRVLEEGDVGDEEPLLINPANEDPEEYISYQYEKVGGQWIAYPLPRDPTDEVKFRRAAETIRIAGLQRTALMGSEERSECVPMLMKLLKSWKASQVLLDRAMDRKADLVAEGADQGAIDQAEELIAKTTGSIAQIECEIRAETRFEKTYAGFRRYLVRKETDGMIAL